MARSLSSIRVSATLSAVLQNALSGSDKTQANQGGTVNPATALTSGTAADQADRAWSDPVRSITSGSSETIDLFDFAGTDLGGGAALDAVGQAAAFTEIVGVLIENDLDSAGSLEVGGDGTTACWNSIFAGDDDAKITLAPGGIFMIFNRANPAYAVADTSNHLLKLAANGGNVTYSITLIGRSA